PGDGDMRGDERHSASVGLRVLGGCPGPGQPEGFVSRLCGGGSANCGASPPMWSHGAFEATKMCISILMAGSPSTLPRVTPCTSPSCIPQRVVPHVWQKQRPYPGADSYRVRFSSPLTHENEPGATSAYAEPEPLNAFLQREQ